jgi:hypothetical protein
VVWLVMGVGSTRGSQGGHGAPPPDLQMHSLEPYLRPQPSPTFFFHEPRTPGTASWSRLMASL